MSRTGKFLPVLIAAIVSFITALTACVIFFFVVYKPVQSSGKPELEVYPIKTAPTPAESPAENVPVDTEKVNLSDIDTVNMRTGYRGFYDAGAKCRTAVDPGIGGSDTSPCTTVLTFNRDGSAVKSIEIDSYYQAGKLLPAEKTAWKANISAEQYNALLKSMAEGKSFISWPMIEMYTSNFSITIEYKGSSMQWIGNLSEKNAGQIPMIETFRQLDSHLNWKKQ